MSRDTQTQVSTVDSPSLPGFLPTHRPEPRPETRLEPRPEPRPGPELPLPSIPAWTGPEIPESGAVEGISGTDVGITGRSSGWGVGGSKVKILQ